MAEILTFLFVAMQHQASVTGWSLFRNTHTLHFASRRSTGLPARVLTSKSGLHWTPSTLACAP
jgi:hypothetical protein